MNHILVTRPEPQAELTALALKEAGFEVIIAPAISLRALPDVSTQVKALNHQADGVIVTSQFALQVLDSNGLERDVPLYVTGKALYTMAMDYGFTLVRYAEGNAHSLLTWLIAQPELKRQLLTVAHGSHIALDMATALQDAGFRIRRQALYHSRTTRSLPPEAITALKQNKVSAALFYSAFTARSFMNLIEEVGLREQLKGITAIGISENVLEALPKSSWRAKLCTYSPVISEVIHTLHSVADHACV